MFGRFDTVGGSGKGVKIRLLTGRMRGQAFVEFKCMMINLIDRIIINFY